MTLYVVRHAHAGVRERWPHDDGQRPLSERGRVQAQKLPEHLRDAPIERILTSPLRRCVDTVQELARERGLEVEVEDCLVEGTPLSQVWDLIRDLGPTHAVLCSHGDVIGGLVRHVGRQGVALPSELAWAKGSTWVLEVQDGEVTGARYRPPPG